jgi:hypothetical protein
MGKTTNLFKNLSDLGKFDLINKNALEKLNLISKQKLKEKRESDPAFIEQQKIENAAKTRRDFQQTVKDAEKKAADEFAGKGSGASGPAGGAAKKAADKKAADKKAAENQDAARGGGGGGGGQGDQSGGRSQVVENLIMVISVSIQTHLFKWLMAVRKKLKIFNLVMTLKVEKLQVYSNLKQLMRYTTTKVLLLQVVTMLKKMVNLLWLKTAYYPSRSIRYL